MSDSETTLAADRSQAVVFRALPEPRHPLPLKVSLLGLCGLLPVFLALNWSLDRKEGRVLTFVLIAIACACVLFLSAPCRWRRRALGRLLPPVSVDERVVCFGEPSVVEAYGGAPDVPFEPKVYSLAAGFPLPRGRIWTLRVGIALAAVITLIVVAKLLSIQSPPTMLWIVLFSLPDPLARLIGARLWPSYVRLSPGRAELIRYALHTRSIDRHRVYDLKETRIRVDLVAQHVSLIGFSPPAPRIQALRDEFSISFLEDPLEFAHRLFLAAISTSPPLSLDPMNLAG